MPGKYHEQDLENISEELNQVSLRRQQITDRRNVLNLLIEFKRSNGRNEQQYSEESAEMQALDNELKDLSERKTQLLAKQDRLGGTPNLIDTSVSSGVIFVESPPSFPAPQVILDVQQLPRVPSQTQCPFCRQYVTTEVTTATGSVACLMCLICIVFGCVAGCCFIPFCVESIKDVIHKCPKCRSKIHTCKKL
ncbi:lipopolysaccharide-induced tumor necrosis factor-alpha factor homolog [Xyrauchen texanus]|uniref:lipopolysaccharide-induced tumor necrosis factor-alpha factor homolog n=1 Tax=Xyrauchen texanus TaxID=154827 RepID=UPI002242445E|nr:lipopolysaccharide-induced tumor necrosis factor-alpha factor homolog [Xyrauchen texanus]XP_051988599.1 lipopolysaccharide-induced tumor necrosis factor-alpha factor homolog [Xyrauchen texanus]XP_051988600.1 lipopolysaccharide-induced tumor necrosis factor-alpha factor homolog [Xyrauchen texanus]